MSRRSAILLFVLFAAGFMLLRPSALGGRVTYFLVWDQAMGPTLRQGDLAAFLRQDDYQVGEMVALEAGPSVTLGKIESLTPDGYGVRAIKDGSLFTLSTGDILGRLWFRIGDNNPT